MDFRACKNILIEYNSLNNYFIYISTNKKVINTRDIKIWEDLVYSNQYKNQDLNLLEKENLDFESIQNKRNDNDSNKKQTNFKIIEIIEISENNESKDKTLNNIEIDIGKINFVKSNI